MRISTIGADIKRLIREPILILLLAVPALALSALKAVAFFGVPIIRDLTGFDLTLYFGYLMSTAFLIAPSMLGTVAAFMMIDDRDENMIELMAVTPMGYSGYIANRLLMPFVLSIIYTLAGYLILNIYPLNILLLIYLAILAGIESVIVGLLLFSLTDNKVKGLTYAKGLSGFMFTALADLLGIGWVSAVSSLIPFYWISKLVLMPATALNAVIALIIHLAWLGIAVSRTKG